MPRKNQSPKHVPYRPNAACQRKQRYASKQAAEKALQSQQKIRESAADVTIYMCSDCGGWHFTSR